MKFESKYISNIKPYKLSSHRAWEMSKNCDVLKLDWNEATIPPSPLVLDRLHDAITNQHLNWYPDVDNKTLLSKIARYSKVDISEAQFFPSSDTIHEYIIRAFIEPDDKILITFPTYDNFRAVAESGGALISYFQYNNSFEIDVDMLQISISKTKPKIVYIVNPNNPTGTLTDPSVLKNLIISNKDTLFVIDEAYYEFCGKSLYGIVSDYENIIITRTFSKAFALASFRIGYIISNKINIQIINKVRNSKSISLFAQIAAEAALDSITYTNQYVSKVIESREVFFRRISNIDVFKVFKSEGNFIFIQVQSIDVKYEIIRYLENKNIFIRDYSHVPGFEDYFRISIGTYDQMDYLYKTIIQYFNLKQNK